MAVMLLIGLSGLSHAGTPVEIGEIPGSESATIEEYFPGATALSAEKDVDVGETEYEVKIKYKEIILEVELLSDGRIIDVEMEE